MFAEIGPLSCFISHHVSYFYMNNIFIISIYKLTNSFVVDSSRHAVLSKYKSTMLQN